MEVQQALNEYKKYFCVNYFVYIGHEKTDRQIIQEIENWALLMKQALNNEQNVVGNIIFSEGEIINE